MLRGFTKFHCTNYGREFVAPDIEWMATVYTAPQPCPNCGSIRTMPKHGPILGRIMRLTIYNGMWKACEYRQK